MWWHGTCAGKGGFPQILAPQLLGIWSWSTHWDWYPPHPPEEGEHKELKRNTKFRNLLWFGFHVRVGSSSFRLGLFLLSLLSGLFCQLENEYLGDAEISQLPRVAIQTFCCLFCSFFERGSPGAPVSASGMTPLKLEAFHICQDQVNNPWKLILPTTKSH